MKRKIFLPLLFSLVITGFLAAAQSPLPVVTVRFNNPQYDCPTQTYCLDVEFKSNSDAASQQLFGMNVRFYYDDNILEFLSLGDFSPGWAMTDPPVIETGPPGSGNNFGITGPLEWFNGTVNLVDFPSVDLTTEYQKLFNVCFHVDDPNSVKIDEFCPSVIWDLQLDPEMGGFQLGDDGVVITLVDYIGGNESTPTTENVEQFNWQYDLIGDMYGHTVKTVCISTICGYVIPLSNWSLFLAIGLMLVASVFIYRRRISG